MVLGVVLGITEDARSRWCLHKELDNLATDLVRKLHAVLHVADRMLIRGLANLLDILVIDC